MKTRPIVAGVTKGASQRREDKSRPADRYRRMKDGGSSNRRGGGTTEMAEIVGEGGERRLVHAQAYSTPPVYSVQEHRAGAISVAPELTRLAATDTSPFPTGTVGRLPAGTSRSAGPHMEAAGGDGRPRGISRPGSSHFRTPAAQNSSCTVFIRNVS